MKGERKFDADELIRNLYSRGVKRREESLKLIKEEPELKEAVLPVLVEHLRGNGMDGLNATRALGKIKDESTATDLIDVYKGLSGKDYCKRQYILEALGQIGGEKSSEFLLEKLENAPKDHFLYCSIVESAGNAKVKGAVPILIKDLDLGPVYWSIQGHAAKALGQIGDKSAIPALEKLKKEKDKKSWIYQAAKKAIEKMNGSYIDRLKRRYLRF